MMIGFGGYPSMPALIAAITQGRPTIIHEQNAVSGRANRLLAPHVTAIATAFEVLGKASPRTQARAVVVGNPVRPDIRALADQGYAPPADQIRLLITGGSQGARLISELLPAALAALMSPGEVAAREWRRPAHMGYRSRVPIALSTILDHLRALQPELRERFGMEAIFIFGSYARGDAEPGSDLDLLIDFAEGSKPTLFSLARLDAVLEAALGLKVDTVPRGSLNPRLAPYIVADLVPA
jgi:predicted nucleotidyltransferase